MADPNQRDNHMFHRPNDVHNINETQANRSAQNINQYPPYNPQAYQNQQKFQNPQNYQHYDTYQQTASPYQSYNGSQYPPFDGNFSQVQNTSDTPVSDTYQNPVEVPIQTKFTFGDTVLAVWGILMFLGMFLVIPFASTAEWICGYMIVFFAFLVYAAIWLAIVTPLRKRRHLEQVCTVPVKGKLAGYDIKKHHNKGHTYYTYAPKYKIYINNRYEIRTLDDYGRNQPVDEPETDLLVNPNGYEIKRVCGRTPRKPMNAAAKTMMITVLVLLGIMILLTVLSCLID